MRGVKRSFRPAPGALLGRRCVVVDGGKLGRRGGKLLVFRILGPLHVLNASITASRQQTVLAMLLLEANNVVPLGRLIDAVWEESPPSTAKSQIQICISAVRRALRDTGLDDRIITNPAGYQIRIAEGELDLHIFNDLLTEARAALREQRLEDAASGFRQALALYRGFPLSGVDSRLVEAAATRLAERRLAVVEDCLELELHLGRHRETIDELMALVSEHPLRERLWQQLITALYRAGRQAEALAAYRSARQASIDDLGLEPSEPLRLLERAILNGDLEPGPAVEPEWPNPIEPAPSVPRMTPADIPDFTGYGELVTELADFLRRGSGHSDRDSVPVLAITGRGGAGKTTLAVHLAHELAAEFSDGQLFSRLGPERSHSGGLSQILDGFLRALGMPGSSIPRGAGGARGDLPKPDRRIPGADRPGRRRRRAAGLPTPAGQPQLRCDRDQSAPPGRHPRLPAGRGECARTARRRRTADADGRHGASLRRTARGATPGRPVRSVYRWRCGSRRRD